MSCIGAALAGGIPEIFPLSADDMTKLRTTGLRAMQSVLRTKSLTPSVDQYVGVALRPDKSPFYLTTLAPKPADALAEPWRGAFYAPFGVGDIVGELSADPGDAAKVKIAMVTVNARLVVQGDSRVHVQWQVIGSNFTSPNKAALIHAVTVLEPGPHNQEDIRRCVALHAPQRIFGEPRAQVALQCGVAAAALLESIC